MVLYSVLWTCDPELSKGKGRIKSDNHLFAFTVLCRNSRDAHACLDWYFRFKYDNRNSLTLDDGVITLRRCTIDSRSFVANYLMMDGIKEPLSLSDLKDSLIKYRLSYA